MHRLADQIRCTRRSSCEDQLEADVLRPSDRHRRHDRFGPSKRSLRWFYLCFQLGEDFFGRQRLLPRLDVAVELLAHQGLTGLDFIIGPLCFMSPCHHLHGSGRSPGPRVWFGVPPRCQTAFSFPYEPSQGRRRGLAGREDQCRRGRGAGPDPVSALAPPGAGHAGCRRRRRR